jgi:hypothetical protein
MEAEPDRVRKSGFCIPSVTPGRFRGRLLLARLPEALRHSGEQPTILEEEAGREQGA